MPQALPQGEEVAARAPGSLRWLAAALLLALAGAAHAAFSEDADAIARGEYLFRAAGGCGCHTSPGPGGAFLAGGRPLKTDFGVFHSPNITPDRDTGIGGWSLEDFTRAMGEGVAPDGSHYFPSFPYVAFTGMASADLADLKAYLDSVPPVRRENTPHDLDAPWGWRFAVGAWKVLNFTRGPFRADPERSERWNRGAYLATALAHCSECHTPRGALGGLDGNMRHAGAEDGPEGRSAPNITPHGVTGIGRWSAKDLASFLKSGMKPDFDNVQGLMAELIDQGFRHLSDDDRAAIAEYVLSLPAIENAVARRKPAGGSPYD